MSIRFILDEIRDFMSSSPKSDEVRNSIKKHLEAMRDDLIGTSSQGKPKATTDIMKHLNRLESRLSSIVYDSWSNFSDSTRMIYARIIDSVSDLFTNHTIGSTIHDTLMRDLQAMYRGKGDFVVDDIKNKLAEFKLNVLEVLEDAR